MNWTEMLKSEMHDAYRAAERLVAMADDEALGWKPATGENWMTTGQLLKHVSDACGATFKGFVTGDWGLPAGKSADEMTPEEMLPSAANMPTVASVAEARELLAADRKLAREMLGSVSEEELATKPTPAPWDPTPMPLGRRLLQMVGHLNHHKAQLYYYLKLQGKPVNTMHFYGMA